MRESQAARGASGFQHCIHTGQDWGIVAKIWPSGMACLCWTIIALYYYLRLAGWPAVWSVGCRQALIQAVALSPS